MSRGEQSVPLETIPDSYNEALKSLPNARRHADDLLVYDNTPNGRGHRLVARFIAGELVKTTNTSPEWVKKVFGRELGRDVRTEGNLHEKSGRRVTVAQSTKSIMAPSRRSRKPANWPKLGAVTLL